MRHHLNTNITSMKIVKTLLAMSSVTVISHLSVAQDTAGVSGLEQIIVTAQRRSEPLQETPVSVTALSMDALEARGMTNLGNVGQFAPNLEMHQTNRPAGGGSTFAAYIRGVGTGDFQFPTDPGVGVYVDDVYLARSVGGLLSLEDIERIEVLKGPQGTLYGRNTIGGAINVVTSAPKTSGEAEYSLKVRVGDYERRDVAAQLNMSIVDGMLGAKLSVARLSSDGYGERYLTSEKTNDEGKFIARGALRFEPTDVLVMTLSGDYTQQRQNPPNAIISAFAPTGATLARINRYNTYAAPALNPQLGLPAGSIFDGRWISSDPRRGYALQPMNDDSDIAGGSLTAQWDVNDALSLKSISAYRKVTAHIEVDGDNGPYPLQQSKTDLYQDQISQEFQLSGNVFDERLDYLFGVYAFREKGHSDLYTQSFHGLWEYVPVPLASDAADTQTYFYMKAESIAAFTQETLALTPTLNITLGGRINKDTKDYAFAVDFTQRNVPQVPYSEDKAEWTSFTPKVGIDWTPWQDVMLYASFSKGFKSGGFSSSNSANVPTPEYAPEKLTAYEIGGKTQWFDNRLTANFAAFYSEYTDIQLTVQSRDPVTGANLRTTQNAGTADIEGFEFELQAAPLRGLTLNLGVGYVDAKLDSISTAAVSAGFKVGDRLPQIPDWSLNAGVQYAFDTAIGEFTVRGDASHKGDQFLTAVDPSSYQSSYTTYGARIAYVPSALPGLELSVNGTNLTDEVYNVYQATLAPTGETLELPAEPRLVFFTAKYAF